MAFYFKKTFISLLALAILFITGCKGGEKQTVIKGRITWLFGSSYYTLVDDNKVRYSIKFMPDYKYVDRTGKYPPDANRKISVLCLGEDGLYRCEGLRKTKQQVIEAAKRTGKRLLYPDCDYFFDIFKIELLEVKGNDLKDK
jgi:hypothetical protein